MRLMTVMVSLAAAAALAGCGGDEGSGQPLRDGVYKAELTKSYLLQNGISRAQADGESGVHTITLAGGSFVDRWRTAEGRTGACRGTYESEGSRVTFRWVSGCFGDWAMTYSVDGGVVTWSDFKALPPYDGDEEQKVTEVFNDLPWTRVGEAPATP